MTEITENSTEAEEEKEKIGEEKEKLVGEEEALGEDGEKIGEDECGDDEEEFEDEGLPLATAPIVRLMRAELDSDKMIRSKVKKEMNLWLGAMCRRVARKMNESEYTMVALDDFKTAIEPYENIQEIEKERERLIISMEKIKQDCDSLIRDINRKFVIDHIY